MVRKGGRTNWCNELVRFGVSDASEKGCSYDTKMKYYVQ